MSDRCKQCGCTEYRKTSGNPYQCKCDHYAAEHDLGVEDEVGVPASPPATGKEETVCISGSTRFVDLMAVEAWELEKRGAIVLACHLLPKWYTDIGHHLAEEQGVAEQLDALHLRKIDAADRLLVVTQDDYIGNSTRREIEYARSLGKPVEIVNRTYPVPASPRGTCTCDDTTSVRGSYERCPIESHNAPGVGVESGTPKPCHICGYHPGSEVCSAMHDAPRCATADKYDNGVLRVSPAPAELDWEKVISMVGLGLHTAKPTQAESAVRQEAETLVRELVDAALARQAQSLAEAVQLLEKFEGTMSLFSHAANDREAMAQLVNLLDVVRATLARLRRHG